MLTSVRQKLLQTLLQCMHHPVTTRKRGALSCMLLKAPCQIANAFVIKSLHRGDARTKSEMVDELQTTAKLQPTPMPTYQDQAGRTFVQDTC